MSPKLLRQIIGILFGAVVGWGLLASWQRQRADRNVGVVLPALDPATTDTIRYVGPGDTVVLARNGAGWTANGFPAAEPVVLTFFRAVTDSSARSGLIAESPASHERLGVDSARAKHLVVVGAGKPLLDLYFGGRGPDFEGFYVRQGDDPRVFLLHGTFANLTVQPVDDWRDKTIVAIVRDSIGHAEIRRGKVTYQVTRGAAGWTLGTAVGDSAKVTGFLGRFGSLKGTGFPTWEQADSSTFAPAERELRLFSAADAPVAELQFDSMAWGWTVRTSTGVLYKLDQRIVDLITPSPDSLRKR